MLVSSTSSEIIRMLSDGVARRTTKAEFDCALARQDSTRLRFTGARHRIRQISALSLDVSEKAPSRFSTGGSDV